MGNREKQLKEREAAAVMYDGLSMPPDGRMACEEGDSPEALAMEAWAECIIARGGVERRVALQCAAAIWELQRSKDAACVGNVLYAGPADGLAAITRESIREMAMRQYQATKPRLSAGALILAIGATRADLKSARDLARQQNCSHEEAAGCVREWQETFRLPITAGQKSEASRRKYGLTNRGRKKGERKS